MGLDKKQRKELVKLAGKEMKRCFGCGVVKGFIDFGRRKVRENILLRGRCKTCCVRDTILWKNKKLDLSANIKTNDKKRNTKITS